MKFLQRSATGVMLGMSFVFAALAQQNSPYDGTWRVKFTGDRGTPEDAELVVNAGNGTWTNNSRRRGSDPCVGRTMPIAVSRATGDELEFAVEGSKALLGCPDFIVSAKRVDNSTLEGKYSDGRRISLVRDALVREKTANRQAESSSFSISED
jgi:hypothetical protein